MFRKLILVSAISVALLPNGAAALGLGAMRTQTALNQPFVGEIDLLDARPDELDTVKVRLASPEAFADVGAERFHYLTKLRFAPQLSARGRPVVRVTSDEPVREPYMALLVEVLWPTGKLIREYTVLLDLPSTTSRPAPAVAPPPVTRPAVSRPEPRSAPQGPARRSPQKPPPQTSRADRLRVSADGYPLRYGPVPRGRGLWQVARRIAPSDATVPQTAMALYRNNQHAFAASDINRLLVGQRLEIPSHAELLALDPAAAEIEFQAALAGKPVRRTPLTEAAAVAAQEGPTQLKIAGTGAGLPVAEASVDDPSAASAGGIDDIEQELLLVREAGESTRQETDHLHERIRQLEAQLTDIQRLLTLRNQQLALLQTSPDQGVGVQLAEEDIPLTTAAKDAAPVLDAAAAKDAESADSASGVDEPIQSPGVDEAELIGEQSMDPDGEEQIILASVEDEVGASPPLLIVDDATPPEQTEQPTALVGAESAAAKTAPAAAAAASDEIESPSFLNALPLPLPWLGAGAAALGLGGLLASMVLRRRRRLDEEQEETGPSFSMAPEPPEIPEPEPRPANLLPDIAQESPHTVDEYSLPASFDTDFPLDEDLDDTDVVSEADIYIAYGRYREAEALLKEELDKYPGRADLQFKLAEAYYGAGDSVALQALSDQMRHSGADRHDEERWQGLLTMRNALESRSDDTDEPPSISSLGALTSGAVDARASDSLPDRIGDDGEAGGQPDLDGRFPLDLGLDLSQMDDVSNDANGLGEMPKPFAERITRPGEGAGGFDEVEDMDLDILIDQPESAHKSVDGDIFDLALPDSAASDLPPSAGGVQVSDPRAAVVGGSESIRQPETPEGLASYLSDTERESVDTRIRELNDEDLSSELLSSQWRMDSGAWDEIGTKMELALAYMDMDDHDGARAILEEVKREGNDEQRAEADELLAKLP